MHFESWEVTLPTKRELGIGYLAGAGVALILSLLGYVLFTHESILVVFVSVFISIGLFATIVYIGYLFLDVDLPGNFVWNVARWTAVGFAVAILLSFLIGFGQDYLPSGALVPSLLVITIATGGLIGTLLGVITGLREQHLRMREVTQRNTVMNRVLRHNIRNDMNVIMGHAEILQRSLNGQDPRALEAIMQTAREVTRLSTAAQRIDELGTNPNRRRVNVSETVRDCVDTVADLYPETTVTTALPEDAWISASPLLRFALMNVIENAIEHNDTTPELAITVIKKEYPDEILIQIADNGPGITAHERDILFADREEPTHHGSGLGLWLVKWFTDQYDGTLRFEDNDPRGTIVCMTFPAADEATPSRTADENIATPAIEQFVGQSDE